MKKIILSAFMTLVLAVQTLAAPPAMDREKLLRAWFLSDDETYFNNELPQDTIILWQHIPKNPDAQILGKTVHPLGGHIYIIYVDPFYNPNILTARLTLLHEECHIANYEEDGDTTDTAKHGPSFDACFDRLYKQGALKDLL